MKIGVLALQGAFIEHVQALRQLGAEAVELRQLPDLEQPLDGIVLPGGESTVQGKLLHELGMFGTAAEKNSAGLAGTGNLRRYDSVGGKADERQQVALGHYADYREA